MLLLLEPFKSKLPKSIADGSLDPDTFKFWKPELSAFGAL